ncbi:MULTISPECIES: hypothetical protein [unclassified Oceanobacter]|uniref:hypothetical protein n=1 Tax=unclassified Oceanobacter TaxID=2620260 RepID=UPI002734D129|nr:MULTISPECIES: hypothetical protein [unclassified Oceanobacter]MDP2609333.1 hypothetical protein [Oceanobacter sp. 1_MG-2023]MDP2612570.1 hypothetical protein [Oceanobacter sp. 2_MG-2023]
MKTSDPLSEVSTFEEYRIYQWFIHGGREQATERQLESFECWLQGQPGRWLKAEEVVNIWEAPEFTAAILALEPPESIVTSDDWDPFDEVDSKGLVALCFAVCMVIRAVVLVFRGVSWAVMRLGAAMGLPCRIRS